MLFWRKKKEEEQPAEAHEPEPTDAGQAVSQAEEVILEELEDAAKMGDSGGPVLMEELPPEPEAPKRGLFGKLRERLARTHASIRDRTAKLFRGGLTLDDASLEELEEILLSADVGMATTRRLVEGLRERAKRFKEREVPADFAMQTLRDLVYEELLHEEGQPIFADEPPTIVLVVGVNGVGKTTAIGKLAHRLKAEGKSVLMIAADTFRAAAAEQLMIWGERAGCEVVRAAEGADPASVVYDGLAHARKSRADVVLIDTAGRLHTKTNLMAELGKIRKIIERDRPGAPHETLLVLDGSTGQNGLVQAKVFTEATPVTGVVLTKLDGTAKGGVTIAIRREIGIPVKWIGVGEKIDDLEPFDPKAFADAIFAAE